MFFETKHGMRPSPLQFNPLNALICPRPIAWISTISQAGDANLAPYSYFNAVAADPPHIMFAPTTRASTDNKDTYANLLDVPEFVVNLVSVDDANTMNATSKSYPHGVDEFHVCAVPPRRRH